MFFKNGEFVGRDAYGNANGSVCYDKLINAVYLTLTGYVESPAYRSALNKCIKLLAMCQTCKLLSDTSQMEALAVEDQDWSESDWAKRAIATGLKYNAIVLSTDTFGRLSIEHVTDHAKVVTVKYFDNVADAKAWLRTL